jgi:hypothetical protein
MIQVNTTMSEVARLRIAITEEQEAAERALHDFGMVGRHDFITAKQQRIGEHFATLRELVSSEQALAIVIEAQAGNDVQASSSVHRHESTTGRGQ